MTEKNENTRRGMSYYADAILQDTYAEPLIVTFHKREIRLNNWEDRPVIIFSKKGKNRTGNSLLANQMEAMFANPFFICARNRNLKDNQFLFDGVTTDTDLIIFDDLSTDHHHFVIDIINAKVIRVNTRTKPTSWIFLPKIIITMERVEEFAKQMSFRLRQRCDFIETDSYQTKSGHTVFEWKKVNIEELLQE